jgi:hypothetical protein
MLLPVLSMGLERFSKTGSFPAEHFAIKKLGTQLAAFSNHFNKNSGSPKKWMGCLAA